jgi:hypothetical protein
LIVRRTFRQFEKGSDLTVLLSLASVDAAEGKYLLGRLAAEPAHLLVAFDESAAFHHDIALRHRLRPAGGGWMKFDRKKRRIHLSGRSQAYGREPDRGLVLRALSRLFPDFTCTAE